MIDGEAGRPLCRVGSKRINRRDPTSRKQISARRMKDRRGLRATSTRDWFRASRWAAIDDCANGLERLSHFPGCLGANGMLDDLRDALLERSGALCVEPECASQPFRGRRVPGLEANDPNVEALHSSKDTHSPSAGRLLGRAGTGR